ncbi:MAG: dipicolinate synthase subunit B [Clostridia bacterium]|nr:dipicolinate synthase subunit B [Clostridia bacterium]
MIGYAFCGSFCTHARSLDALKHLVAAGYEVQPIVSEHVYETDTRFGTAKELTEKLETLCSRPVLHTIVETEPLGPRMPLELLIIAPCTGNTLAKLSRGITDTSVTMAAKAQLRADRPLLIGLATNDALSGNLESIARLNMHRCIRFVPLEKDDPEKKPYSLVCRFEEIPSMTEELVGKP